MGWMKLLIAGALIYGVGWLIYYYPLPSILTLSIIVILYIGVILLKKESEESWS